jgi:saccharopine dehydrogenase-like NADP-dependent oxidoreductase
MIYLKSCHDFSRSYTSCLILIKNLGYLNSLPINKFKKNIFNSDFLKAVQTANKQNQIP